jgi:hypothetical protein
VGLLRLQASSTFRRKAHSMRRISTVSAQSWRPACRGNRSQSVASWIWYSSSQVDLMLMSRKRANSFELVEPHPSTMLKATDSAALTIWDLSDPRSLRGNPLIARRTLSTSSCALCHTSSRRKSCTPAVSTQPRERCRPFPAPLPQSLPSPLLTTTNNCLTNQLTTQNLDPLRPTSNSSPRDSAGMR